MRTLSLAAFPSSILFPSAPCAGTDLQNTRQTHPLKPVRVPPWAHIPVLIHCSLTASLRSPGRRGAGMAPKGSCSRRRECGGGAVPAGIPPPGSPRTCGAAGSPGRCRAGQWSREGRGRPEMAAGSGACAALGLCCPGQPRSWGFPCRAAAAALPSQPAALWNGARW